MSTPTEPLAQKPERVTTTSLLDSIVENNLKQEYAKQLIETEVVNKQFDFEWRLARTFADSGEFDLVKGKTPDQAVASAMAKIQMGKYWGINPADSMRFIRFDRGKPILENEIIAAKLQDAGWEWDLEFSENDRGRCSGCFMYPKRKDGKGGFTPLVGRDGNQVCVQFTEKEASEAMIWEKDKQIRLIDKWNYKSWPEDMYYTKVIARFKRRYAPGVLAGARTADEIGEQYEPPEQTQPEGNPFKPVQRPALEAGAEPQEVPTGKSVNGYEQSKAKEQESLEQAKAASQPMAAEPAKSELPKGGKSGTRSHVDPKPKAEPEKPAPATQEGTTKADDDYLPPILQGKAEAAPGPVLVQPSPAVKEALAEAKAAPPIPQLDRFKGIAGELAKVGTRDSKAVQKAVQEFILAFTNMPKYLPQPQDKYNDPLDFLELISKRFGIAFLQDPHKMGLDVGVGWRELQKKVDGWQAEGKTIAKQVALKHFPDGPDLVVALIDTAQGEGELPEVELACLLWICLWSSEKTAIAFKNAADAKGVTMQDFCAPLAIAPTEGEILTLIAGGQKSVDGQDGKLWEE